MPNPGTIAHSRNGSFEWDGQGWIPRPDVPNPMAGDAVAEKAQQETAAKGNYLGRLFSGANPLSGFLKAPAPPTPTLRPDPTAGFVDAAKEAYAHPEEVGPAFQNAEPEDVGHALGALGTMFLGPRIAAGLPDVLPSGRTLATGINTAAEVVPKNILGTDLPIKDLLQKTAAKIDAPPAEGFDRFMPNKGNAPRPAVDLSGTVTPTKGVEDVLNDLGGYRSDINSGLSPELAAKLNGRVNPSLASLKKVATPDLMDEFQSASDTGVGSGKQEFDMDGVHYAPDESGSHVAQVAAPNPWEAYVPDFTFEGQNLNGEPPAFGRGPEGYSPRVVTPIAEALPGQGGIDPEALARLRRAIDPKTMQDWYENNPGGMRTNRMSSTP